MTTETVCTTLDTNSICRSLKNFIADWIQFAWVVYNTRKHINPHHIWVGRDSIVNTGTHYGLDGLEIISWWGKIFSTHPDWPWGLPSLMYNGHRVIPCGKAAGAWRWPPTPSSTEVKEGVELYIYYPSGPSWTVLAWNLPLPYHIWSGSIPGCTNPRRQVAMATNLCGVAPNICRSSI